MGSFEVARLSKTFGRGRPVLDDLSFRYEGSGAIGYLGPNGAGKTTTLKLFTGLLRPTRGRALVNGLDPIVDRKRALWDVGALIETPEPYPMLTVYDALDIVGKARGLAADDIDAEIDRCHALLELPSLEWRAGGLSKGQRQRVVLAAALMGDPAVLLLDEPTSGMDPAERVLVRRLFNRLKRDHLLLICSHQMLEVSEVCDQLIVLHRGRILLQDRVDAIAARFRSRKIDVEFARPVPADRGEPLRAIATEATPLSDRRWRLTFDGSDAVRGRLLEACQGIGPIVQFSNTSLALEEAYLDLVATAGAAG